MLYKEETELQDTLRNLLQVVSDRARMLPEAVGLLNPGLNHYCVFSLELLADAFPAVWGKLIYDRKE